MLISRRSYLMRSDIRDTENAYILEVDLPGCAKEDIKTYVEDGYLVVSAVVNKKDENDNGKLIRRERYTGEYQRRFYIGKAVIQSEIRAQFKNGVLKLTIPKEIKPKEETKATINID